MKRFRLTITCDSDAFVNDNQPEWEVARILKEIANKYLEGDQYHDGNYDRYLNALDVNGNVVGQYRLEDETRSDES